MTAVEEELFLKILANAQKHFRGDDEFYLKKAFGVLLQTTVAPIVKKSRIEEVLETALMATEQLNLGIKALVSIFLNECVGNLLSFKQIEEQYGTKVLSIVEGLQKVKKIDTSTSNIHSENFIKLLLVQANDVRVILILLVEKIFLSRYIKDLKDDERIKLCNEFSSLYAPLAHRLGLYNIKLEMEEQALKFLHNDIYKTIAGKLAEKKKEREEYIKAFIEPLDEALKQKGIKYTIKGRPKSIFSIWKKIKNNKVDFDKIYDLFAIRIIVDSIGENEKADCWMVYSVVSDIYTPNPNRLRDWISSPKSSGYESLHTTVVGPQGKWVEVQIRTVRMDEIAEKGHAAHWKYKEGANAVGSTNWLGKIRAALESPNPDAFEKEHTSKIDLYSDEIFIFTPTGDLKKMPAGATILDFAFEIHTNVGSRCTGGKINGKIVPIKQKLVNGDKVEILTSKNQTPKQDWVNIAHTHRAKSKIRKYLKESQFAEAEEGKEILIRKLNQIKVKFADDSVFKLIKFFNAKDSLDLYLKIANNKVDTSLVKNCFTDIVKADDKKPEQIVAKDFEKKLHKKIVKDDNFLILDKAVDNIDYKLAKCCNPIHGDEIFGFISATGGIKIHRINCPNAHQMTARYPYRIIKATWNEVSTNSKFLVGIMVTGTDEIGIISHITQVLAQDMKVDMRGINISSNDNNFEGKITVYIRDIHHLDSVLAKLKSIKGVHTASRYDL